MIDTKISNTTNNVEFSCINAMQNSLTLKKKLKPPPTSGGLTFSFDEELLAREQGKILRISIEITKGCNLRCIYCYGNSAKASKNELSKEEIFKIIKEAKTLGAKSIVLLGGEPLICDFFFEIIDFINYLDLQPCIFTNCSLITKEIAEKLFEKNILITGKLNSFITELQDRFSGINGSYNKIVKGLEHLINIGFTRGNFSRLSIHSIICKENLAEIPSMFIWMRKNNIIPHLQLLTYAGRAQANLTCLSSEEAKDIFYYLLKIDQEVFGYTWIPTPPLVCWSCHQYYCSCYIDAEGFVKPCSSVKIHVDNIRSKNLGEILNSEFFRMTRNVEKHLEGKCQSCSLRGRCYGCRGHSFGVTNNLFSSDPYCWHI